MSKLKILLTALLIAVLSQISCKVIELEYSASRPTPIYAQIPSLLQRGEKYTFSIETIPGVDCHAGVAFFDIKDKWVIRDLPGTQANENGICQWTWEVPKDAKDGLGEFRGYIDEDGQSRNTFPATFCIETCP